MWTYSRRQLAILLVFATAAAAGIAIGHWRRLHPELAARLEAFDQSAPVPQDASRGNAVPDAMAAVTSATVTSQSTIERAPSQARLQRADEGSRKSKDPGAGLERNGRGRKAAGSRDAATVDLNRATADDLMRLPGIGPVLAARIIAQRDADGRFATVDDLRRVAGVGPAKIERFRSLLTVAP